MIRVKRGRDRQKKHEKKDGEGEKKNGGEEGEREQHCNITQKWLKRWNVKMKER